MGTTKLGIRKLQSLVKRIRKFLGGETCSSLTSTQGEENKYYVHCRNSMDHQLRSVIKVGEAITFSSASETKIDLPHRKLLKVHATICEILSEIDEADT